MVATEHGGGRGHVQPSSEHVGIRRCADLAGQLGWAKTETCDTGAVQ